MKIVILGPIVVIAGLGVLLVLTPPSSASSYAFTTIDPPGSTLAQVSGINNAGQIVGTASTNADPRLRGFRLDPNGSFTFIDAPGASYDGTTGLGINDVGQIVGAYASGLSQFGYLRDTNGTLITLIAPGAGPTGNGTIPLKINNPGQIIGDF